MANGEEPYGVVALWSPPGQMQLTYLLLGLLVATITLVLQLDYAEKISVQGTAQPQTKPVVVRNQVSGTVERVFVELGQQVSKGTALLSISRQLLGTSGQSEADVRLRSIRAQRGILQQERQQNRLLVEAKAAHHEQLVLQIDQRLTLRRQQLVVLQRQYALALAEFERGERLKIQGHIGQAQLDQLTGRVLTQQRSMLNAQDSVQNVQADMANLIAEKSRSLGQANLQVMQISRQIEQLNADANLIRQAEHETIVAPASGRVEDLVVHAGQTASAGEGLLAIVPPTPSHEIELLLSSVAAGRVRRGMSVRLRYSGYPHQEFGAGRGEITRVASVAAVGQNQNLFRALVAVLEQPKTIDHVPAGMRMDADIVLDEKPLWHWLLQPVQAAFNRL